MKTEAIEEELLTPESESLRYSYVNIQTTLIGALQASTSSLEAGRPMQASILRNPSVT